MTLNQAPIEVGTVSDEDMKAMYALLIEHAGDSDEPGAWIAETAAEKLREMR